MKNTTSTVFKYCLTTACIITTQFSFACLQTDDFPAKDDDKLPPPTKIQSSVNTETNENQESKLLIATLTVYDKSNQIVYQEDFDANSVVIIPDWVLEDNTYTWTITYTEVDADVSQQ